MSAATRVYVARLAGVAVFDPLGDQVGKVRDVVVLVRPKGPPRAVGLVVEVPGRRRVFAPLTRVTSMDSSQVIITGLLNLRRFEQRALETLAVSELLERRVALADGSGAVTVVDLGISQQRSGDWLVDKVFVRRDSSSKGPLGFRRRGETRTLDVSEVTGLATVPGDQGATLLLAAYEDMKAADLADVLHDLGDTRRLEVAAALDDERLADVLEELPGTTRSRSSRAWTWTGPPTSSRRCSPTTPPTSSTSCPTPRPRTCSSAWSPRTRATSGDSWRTTSTPRAA